MKKEEIGKVVLYTNHCPKCMVLEKKLKEKGIEFATEDNIDVVLNVANMNGIKFMPFMNVEGIEGLMDFNKAIQWLKEVE